MDTNVPPPVHAERSPSGGGFINFIANAVTLLALALMAVGIVAATVHWRSHTIEFVGADRIRLTQSEWWGLSEVQTSYRSTALGWVLIRDGGDEVPVSLQPIKISD